MSQTAQPADALPSKLLADIAQLEEWRAEVERAVSAGDEDQAQFMSMLVESAEDNVEQLRGACTYACQAGYGATLRSKDGRRWATIFPDASHPGKSRYQAFDVNGWICHHTSASIEDAIYEAADDGFVIPDPDAPSRIFSLESFTTGNQVASVLAQLNAGQIDHEQADRLVAEIRGTSTAEAA